MESNKSFKTSIIRIGNSQGVRLPKAFLAMSGIDGEVEIVVEKGSIVIRPSQKPREGWAEAFKEMAASGDDKLMDEPSLSEWDKEEWEWQ